MNEPNEPNKSKHCKVPTSKETCRDIPGVWPTASFVDNECHNPPYRKHFVEIVSRLDNGKIPPPTVTSIPTYTRIKKARRCTDLAPKIWRIVLCWEVLVSAGGWPLSESIARDHYWVPDWRWNDTILPSWVFSLKTVVKKTTFAIQTPRLVR